MDSVKEVKMKFKTLLTINSILSVIAGILCVLMPAQLLSSYGISLIPMGLVIYQFWGAALIGLGMLTWFVRKIKEPAMQRSIALSLFVTHGLNTIMAIRGQFAGANKFGWSNVALFLLLALGFGFTVVMNSFPPKYPTKEILKDKGKDREA